MTSEVEWDSLTKDDQINLLTESLNKALDRVESNLKDPLLKSIAPRLDISWEELAKKALPELQVMKDTLDVATTPSFRSGTPLTKGAKQSQSELLSSRFERDQAARLERSRKIKEA